MGNCILINTYRIIYLRSSHNQELAGHDDKAKIRKSILSSADGHWKIIWSTYKNEKKSIQSFTRYFLLSAQYNRK
jgi:hypothetical protein